MASCVTFDAGQTLVELDLDFLARRLGERGVPMSGDRLRAAAPAAWTRFDAAIALGSGHPWRLLISGLLVGAGVGEADAAPLVEWLHGEQPRRNLWRAPIPGMIALAGELAARGVAVGVVSNSEGRLAELLAELGLAAPFRCVIDSGRLGIEKPDPRIFDAAIDALGLPPGSTGIHIGDSWKADVEGALAAGWRAIWYGAGVHDVADPRVAAARNADEVRAVLARWT